VCWACMRAQYVLLSFGPTSQIKGVRCIINWLKKGALYVRKDLNLVDQDLDIDQNVFLNTN
jgi:hypothetical protein